MSGVEKRVDQGRHLPEHMCAAHPNDVVGSELFPEERDPTPRPAHLNGRFRRVPEAAIDIVSGENRLLASRPCAGSPANCVRT
ncbi:hypothetical protein BN126310452 [Stenotrophomonas thermophila]|nr:hypothetical protein BN126310452 [Stenotrophomonas maltophilia]